MIRCVFQCNLMNDGQIIKYMTSRLLDSFLEVQDLDLRRSLYPISGTQYEHRFTKFVRHRNTINPKSSHVFSEDNDRIIFNPNLKTEKSSFNQILQRYHDQSFVAKKRDLTIKQGILLIWGKLIKTVLLEGNTQTIFKKDSYWLLLWNFMVIYAYLFNIYQIPVAMFFTSAVYQDEFSTFAGLFLNWLAITIIIINIFIVRPNTQFQKLGYLISNRKQIIQGYFGLKCFFDVFALIILLIYALSGNHELVYLKLLFYLDVWTIFSIDRMIIDKIELKPFAYATYKLVRLMAYMIFILVWLSSIYFYIDYNFYVNQTYTGSYNWLTFATCSFQVVDGLPNGTDIIMTYPGAWYIWLNYAIYWALQTISTVGYGDITPRNPISVTFTNISILIMMFFFVFFINSVIELIDQMTSSEQRQKKRNIKKFKLYYINAKQKLNQISLKYSYSKETIEKNQKALENTSNNIRSYLYEMDINNLLKQEENVESLVNQSLTPQLRQELFINYRQLFFKKVLVFGQIAKISDQFMNVYEKLIYKIKEVPFGSDEVIYARGQRRSNNLYYLLKGTVHLEYPNSNYKKLIQFNPTGLTNQQFNANNEGSYFNFGVRQFFTREERDHHAITKSYCKIQLLNYSDFTEIIKEYKDFYYKFCELRDVIKINRVNSLTGEECYECESRKHHLFNCQKCLFNQRIHIQNQWANSYKVQVNTIDNAQNQRFPFYYRDSIATQKINPNAIVRRSIPEDTILTSKFYKYEDSIFNFGDK